MTDIEIEITQPKRQTKPEVSLEERIIAVRDKFMSQKSQDVERMVEDALTESYDELILKELNLRRGRWNDDPKWEFAAYNDNPASRELRERVKEASGRILDQLDFSKVELTQGQVNAIKAAYQQELKLGVERAARDLAERDAIKVAAKVLGIEIEVNNELD